MSTKTLMICVAAVLAGTGVLAGAAEQHAVVSFVWEKVLWTNGEGEWERYYPPDDGAESPRGEAVDNQGRIFVCDSYRDRILVFGPEGERLAIVDLEGRLAFPANIAVDEADNVYVSTGLAMKDSQATHVLLRPASSGWEIIPVDFEEIELAPGAQLPKIFGLLYLEPLGFDGLRALAVKVNGDSKRQIVDSRGKFVRFAPTIENVYRDKKGRFYEIWPPRRLRVFNASGELALETKRPDSPRRLLLYRGWVYVLSGDRLYRFAEDGRIEEEVSGDAPRPKGISWPLLASPRADHLYSLREQGHVRKWKYRQVTSKGEENSGE